MKTSAKKKTLKWNSLRELGILLAFIVVLVTLMILSPTAFAKPANLLRLMSEEKISTKIKAHGTAVGMPSDGDQGNSEVGHNALGAGRVFAQGARLVDDAISSERLFEGAAWKELVDNALAAKTPLHFIGLLSDGNVRRAG